MQLERVVPLALERLPRIQECLAGTRMRLYPSRYNLPKSKTCPSSISKTRLMVRRDSSVITTGFATHVDISPCSVAFPQMIQAHAEFGCVEEVAPSLREDIP